MTISKMLGRQKEKKPTCDAGCGSGQSFKWTRYGGFRARDYYWYHGSFLLMASSSSSLIRACLASSMISSSVLICIGVSHLSHLTVSLQPLLKSSQTTSPCPRPRGPAWVKEGEGEKGQEILTPLSPINFPIFLRFSSRPSPSSQVMGHG